MAEKSQKYLTFCHICKLDVAELNECKFNEGIWGPDFATTHYGVPFYWKIGVHPKGGQYKEERVEHMQMLLRCTWKPTPINLCGTIYEFFITKNDDSILYEANKNSIRKNSFWPESFYTKCRTLLRFENLDLEGLLCDNCTNLNIGVKLRIPVAKFDPYQGVNNVDDKKESYGDFERFLFENLKRKTKFSDFVLLANDNTRFYVLGRRLAFNCLYFETMFSDERKVKFSEEETKECKMESLSGPVLKEILRFILLNETSDAVETHLEEVLNAAEMMSLNGLKRACELHIIRLIQQPNLKPKKLLHLYDCSKVYRLEMAKMVSICYLADRWPQLEHSKEIMKIKKNSAKLLTGNVMCESVESWSTCGRCSPTSTVIYSSENESESEDNQLPILCVQRTVIDEIMTFLSRKAQTHLQLT